MEIPSELFKQIEFLCSSNSYGLLTMKGHKFNALIMGHKDFSPEQISLIIAHALLEGLLDGRINESNENSIIIQKESERKM